MKKCKINHKRDEWCKNQITLSQYIELTSILDKLNCCIPHSQAYCTANECPSCLAEDLIKAVEHWIVLND